MRSASHHPRAVPCCVPRVQRWLVAYYCAGALSFAEAEAIAQRMRARHHEWRAA